METRKAPRRERAKQRENNQSKTGRNEREREREGDTSSSSLVEGLKSYHFFVVYLCVCFYVGDEFVVKFWRLKKECLWRVSFC